MAYPGIMSLSEITFYFNRSLTINLANCRYDSGEFACGTGSDALMVESIYHPSLPLHSLPCPELAVCLLHMSLGGIMWTMLSFSASCGQAVRPPSYW